MPWTRFFKRSALAGGPGLNAFMGSLSRIFEGMGEREVFDVACREVKDLFKCEQVVLMRHKLGAATIADGDWILRPHGSRSDALVVSHADALAAPKAVAGELLPYSEELAHVVVKKAIALAFELGEFYGCDLDSGRVVLLRDPGPEDDIGSGSLSLLAIPLVYRHRVGRRIEQARVGVLVLYGLPVAVDLRPLEGFLRTLLGYALTTPACTLRDPVTGLYTAQHLEDEVARYFSGFALTQGKLQGGLVVGVVDALPLYRQHLEAAAAVPPAGIQQRVAEVVRTVGHCLSELATAYSTPGLDYRSGVPARVGSEGFGVLLPLLRDNQLTLWARRLIRMVEAQRYPSEEARSVSISLRVIPFGLTASSRADTTWQLGQECLQRISADQARVAGNKRALNDLLRDSQILTRKGWRPLGEAGEGGEFALPPPPEPTAPPTPPGGYRLR